MFFECLSQTDIGVRQIAIFVNVGASFGSRKSMGEIQHT